MEIWTTDIVREVTVPPVRELEYLGRNLDKITMNDETIFFNIDLSTPGCGRRYHQYRAS